MVGDRRPLIQTVGLTVSGGYIKQIENQALWVQVPDAMEELIVTF